MTADVGGAERLTDRSGQIRVRMSGITIVNAATGKEERGVKGVKDNLVVTVLSSKDKKVWDGLLGIAQEAKAVYESGGTYGEDSKNLVSCPTAFNQNGKTIFSTNTRISGILSSLNVFKPTARCAALLNPSPRYAIAIGLSNWKGKSLCLDSTSAITVIEHRSAPSSIKNAVCR